MAEKLERFLLRQEETHAQALDELRAGRKMTHWIWWELPQLRELGRSQRAYDYGISDLEEAAAYLAHPQLGPRLVEMCEALLVHSDQSAESILGPVDAMKLQSMASLFAAVADGPGVFERILDQFYGGKKCALTDALLVR